MYKYVTQLIHVIHRDIKHSNTKIVIPSVPPLRDHRGNRSLEITVHVQITDAKKIQNSRLGVTHIVCCICDMYRYLSNGKKGKRTREQEHVPITRERRERRCAWTGENICVIGGKATHVSTRSSDVYNPPQCAY